MIGMVNRMILKDGNEQSYVFIKDEKGTDYFMHKSAMSMDEWYEMSGLVGSGNKVKVEFEVVTGNKGPRAENATIVRN